MLGRSWDMSNTPRNDSTLEVSCKRTMLANLTKWYVLNYGRNPKSKADLLRTVLEEAERAIIVDGVIEPVGSIEEAQAVLGEAGLYELNRLGKMSKGLSINIRAEKNRNKYSPEDIISGAKQFLDDMRKKEEVKIKEQDYSAENLRKQLGTVPEGIVVKTDERSE